MEIKIDFDNKIIKLEQKVNLGELFSKLEELLPDLKWREYDIEVINRTIPTYPTYPTYPTPTYPWDIWYISETDCG